MKSWIRHWQKVSEMRVLAESFLFCSLLPSLFYLLPAWSAYFSGAFTRDYLVNPGRSVGAILSAPIVETAILFVPILEICRKLKVPPVWTILCFAAFFESLHTFRGFFGHLILYPTGVDAYGSLSCHAGSFLLACLSFYGSHSRTLQCLRFFREPAQLQVLDRLILAGCLGRERSSKLLPFRVWSPSELLHLFRGVVVKTRDSVLALEEIYPGLVVIAVEVGEQVFSRP